MRESSWPSEEQELLLRAALARHDARLAWDIWRRSVDLERLDEGSFRLLPLLYHNVAQLTDDDRLPRLKGVHRQSWYKNQLLFREMARTINALGAGGIDTLLLKGIPLALRYYRDEATRPMADADILVRPSQIPKAIAVLARCGWRPQSHPPALPLETRASWPFTDGERELDLHWRVFSNSRGRDEEFWKASVPLSVRDAETRALAPADQLLHVLVHGLQWSPIPSIRWIADAAMVIERSEGALDWERFHHEASTRRFLAPVSRALAYLHARQDVEVPGHVLERLRGARPTRGEQLELWSRLHASAGSAALRLWFDYRRFQQSEPSRAPVSSFASFLRSRWGLGGEDSLSTAIARKVAKRTLPA